MASRKTARGLVIWEDLTIKLEDGRVMSGTYGYSDRYVTVKTALGSKTTQIGGSPPRILARIMLRELADEGKA
jgi:hypothetical protein